MFSVLSFPICSITNHHPIGLIASLLLFFCMYEVNTVCGPVKHVALCFISVLFFPFSLQLLKFFFCKCPCFYFLVICNIDSTVFPFSRTFCFQLVRPVLSVTAPLVLSSCQWLLTDLWPVRLASVILGKGFRPLLTAV